MGVSIQSEEDSEAGGNLSLEAVLAESSFTSLPVTYAQVEKSVFFTSVLFTNDRITSGEKTILGDTEVSWSAGRGVCPGAEPTGPTAGAGPLCDGACAQPGTGSLQGSIRTWQKHHSAGETFPPLYLGGNSSFLQPSKIMYNLEKYLLMIIM